MHQQTVVVAGVLRHVYPPVSGNPWWLTGPVKTISTPFRPPTQANQGHIGNVLEQGKKWAFASTGKTVAGTCQNPKCAEKGAGKSVGWHRGYRLTFAMTGLGWGGVVMFNATLYSFLTYPKKRKMHIFFFCWDGTNELV